MLCFWPCRCNGLLHLIMLDNGQIHLWLYMIHFFRQCIRLATFQCGVMGSFKEHIFFESFAA